MNDIKKLYNSLLSAKRQQLPRYLKNRDEIKKLFSEFHATVVQIRSREGGEHQTSIEESIIESVHMTPIPAQTEAPSAVKLKEISPAKIRDSFNSDAFKAIQ
jgi:hypothetical protein